ncbi:asparaginyl-tRNA synthetase [Atractiella rhizophila]|nr:asparaginyl-tRNA synthetase [Atractiella rhizophila]
MSLPSYYVSPAGSDESGDGSLEKPFASLLGAFTALKNSEVNLLVKSEPKEGEEAKEEWVPATQSALKKWRKIYETQLRKASKAASTPPAQTPAPVNAVDPASYKKPEPEPKLERKRIKDLSEEFHGKRVKVGGWVHRLRAQKGLAFVVLRDGYGYLQAVFAGKELSSAAANLPAESTLYLTGELKKVPEGQTAPGGHELVVDWFEVVGLAPAEGESFTNKIQKEAGPEVLADLRHLVLRGENASAVLKVRSALMRSFRHTYENMSILEVTPPYYYGQPAYLTQSSQLYLETCLPSLGDVFTVQESFRAEKSHTRRHLSEFTHLEAELAWLNFDQLVDHIEELICSTLDHLLSDPANRALVDSLQEEGKPFVPPQRPFIRMDYREAIKWLNEHGIKNDVGEDHKVGDDIKEAAERKMTDTIGRPVFLMRFPKEIKSFYMKLCPGDEAYTESCDLLMPGVGEIVGGSMRISDLDQLMEGYKREGIDPTPYYWFTDQRRYGTTEHGGYGLGVERFLAWLTNRYTVRECSLFPRWMGRATP